MTNLTKFPVVIILFLHSKLPKSIFCQKTFILFNDELHSILVQELLYRSRKTLENLELKANDIQKTYFSSESSNQFLKQNTSLTFYLSFKDLYFGTMTMPIGTNNWDVKTYKNKLEQRY